MRRVFEELIERIIEAYINNIVFKSRWTGDLVPDLIEVIAKLRQHGVKLNPEKCVFGVPRGMLFGFVVSECGIEANPEKISAIMGMRLIKNLKGVQRVRLPRDSEPFHSTTRRAQPATVQTDEEVRPLYMNSRGTRSTRLTQKHAQEPADPHSSDT
jgi:hypothetical protein